MRRLIQPEVSKHAAIAALATALLCYPRFSLWNQRLHPLWYLEAVTFCGAFVLWAFIFAWHTQYTKRPVFTVRISGAEWVVASISAVIMAFALFFFLDPHLRQTTPEDYPANLPQWAAMTLFSLALNQLFLVYAPFAWLVRLSGRTALAVTVTVLFGVVVLLLKTRMSPVPFPASLLTTLVVVRLLLGLLSVSFYLRGGLLLASWCALLVQARHLPGLLSAGPGHGG